MNLSTYLTALVTGALMAPALPAPHHISQAAAEAIAHMATKHKDQVISARPVRLGYLIVLRGSTGYRLLLVRWNGTTLRVRS